MKKILIIIKDKSFKLFYSKKSILVDGEKYKLSAEEPLIIETEKDKVNIILKNQNLKKEVILKEDSTAVLIITIKAFFSDTKVEYINENIDAIYRKQFIKYANSINYLNFFDKKLAVKNINQKILIDSKNKLWKINDETKKKDSIKVYGFEDIEYCEFKLGRTKTIGGDIGKAFLGNGFLGNLASRRDITYSYNHCTIRIYLKNQAIPFEEIRFDFYNNYTELEAYKSKTYLKAKELYNQFKEITNSSEKETKSKNKIDTKKLLEIKELLDENLITKEEFNKIKNEIIGG